jgi:hypothetical protein
MEVWTMRFSTQLVIDVACGLIVIALLVVPLLVTQGYQPQATTNAGVHRVSASAAHLRAQPARFIAHTR